MTIFRLTGVLISLLVLSLVGLRDARADEFFRDKLINLGTSGQGGVFFGLGEEICTEVNKARRTTLIRCVASATGGIDYNIQAVSAGDLQVAFALSASTKYLFPKNVRKLVNLYDAPVLMFVKANSDISGPEQLRGKRINIGAPTSTKRAIIGAVLDAAGVSVADLAAVAPMETLTSMGAFCNNELDAMIEVLPVPNASYERLIKECGGRVVSLGDKVIDRVLASEPRFEEARLDLATASLGDEASYRTLGQHVMLISGAQLDREAVKRFRGALMIALDRLSKKNELMQSWDAAYGLKKTDGLPDAADTRAIASINFDDVELTLSATGKAAAKAQAQAAKAQPGAASSPASAKNPALTAPSPAPAPPIAAVPAPVDAPAPAPPGPFGAPAPAPPIPAVPAAPVPAPVDAPAPAPLGPFGAPAQTPATPPPFAATVPAAPDTVPPAATPMPNPPQGAI